MAKSFNKANPCPVCGGFGGSYNKSRRCRGFRGDYYVYCEQPNQEYPKNFLGFNLYPYKETSDEATSS